MRPISPRASMVSAATGRTAPLPWGPAQHRLELADHRLALRDVLLDVAVRAVAAALAQDRDLVAQRSSSARSRCRCCTRLLCRSVFVRTCAAWTRRSSRLCLLAPLPRTLWGCLDSSTVGLPPHRSEVRPAAAAVMAYGAGVSDVCA